MALGGGGNVLGLIFKIKADGTEKTKEDIRSLRAEFNKEVNDIKTGGTSAFLSIGQSAGFSTEQLALFKTGALAAAGAAVTLTTAIIGAGVALFELTKKTADFGEEIWNTHLKTGFSIQSVQAFKAAGEQADVTLQQMSTGLIRFTNNLAAADAGNKKMIATLRNDGIKTYNDSEKALREFLTHVAGLKTEQEKVAAFSSAFGARMGGTFNQLFQQMGYDVDKFVDTMQKDGRLWTDEQIRMADAFGDLYKQVSQQLAALTYQVGFKLMPIFGGAMTVISTSLRENQKDWQVWGDILQNVVRGVTTDLLALGKFINQSVQTWKGMLLGIASIASPGLGLLRYFGPGGVRSQADADLTKGIADFKASAADAGGGDSDFHLPPQGKTKKDQQPKRDFEADIADLRNQISERESAYREETEKIKAEYQERLKSFQEYIDAEKKAASDRFVYITAKLNEEQAKVDAAARKGIIRADEQLKKSSDIDKQKIAATNAAAAEEEKLNAEAYKHEQDLLAKHNANIEALNQRRDSDAISDAARMRDIKIEDAEEQITNERELINKKLQLELDYNQQLQKIRLDAIDRQEVALTEEVNLIAQHYAKKHKITYEEAAESKAVVEAATEIYEKMDALEYERSRIIKETSDANIRAHREEKKSLEELWREENRRASEGASRPRRATGYEGNQSQFEKLQKLINDHFGEGTAKAKLYAGALEIVGNAASQVADAVGNVVRNFVLFGNAGTTFRKFAAEVIASIAQMAIVKAVFELAEGLAALARMWFGDPTAGQQAHFHLLAAAQYGIIGGVAAIAGRAVAGNAFQDKSASAGSGGGSGTGGGTSSSNQQGLPDFNINRFRGIPTTVHLEVTVKRDAGSIVDVVTRDYQSNGKLRQLVVKDGVTAR